jgi:hypothetical protein
MIVYLHGNVQKTAIMINILRWQILVINLYNKDIAVKTIVAKFIIFIGCILMVFSSYVMIYIPNTNSEDPLQLHYVLGNVLNSYLINMCIIAAYVNIYTKLRFHYNNLDS